MQQRVNLSTKVVDMKICVISNGFPTKRSASSIFVVKLCEQWADQGHEVSIVTPQSLTNILMGKSGHTAPAFTYYTAGGKTISVYRPRSVTFSNIPLLKKVKNWLRQRAIAKAVKRIGSQDVYYCHFWNNGYDLYKAIGNMARPLIVATGESVIHLRTVDEKFRQAVNGAVCVSTKNMEESVCLGLTTREKCIVLPNAIDTAVFHKIDKQKCRQELRIEPELFVVVYVGQFIKRKGYDRLAAAIDMLDDKDIGVIFLGKDNEGKVPLCRGVIHQGFANQQEIAKYLNAADVFVLPTQAEGCSNAIVEAMACGLPIISSDLPFNHDILDSQNALLINPEKVEQIAEAIKKIKDNKTLQTSLGARSLEKAQSLTLPERAERIISFINSKIQK